MLAGTIVNITREACKRFHSIGDVTACWPGLNPVEKQI